MALHTPLYLIVAPRRMRGCSQDNGKPESTLASGRQEPIEATPSKLLSQLRAAFCSLYVAATTQRPSANTYLNHTPSRDRNDDAGGSGSRSPLSRTPMAVRRTTSMIGSSLMAAPGEAEIAADELAGSPTAEPPPPPLQRKHLQTPPPTSAQFPSSTSGEAHADSLVDLGGIHG